MRHISAMAAVQSDARLPGLARACDPAAMAPIFAAAAVAPGHAPPEVTLLKHVAGKRCVLGYVWPDGTRVIGKMYRKDRARRHAGLLAALGAQLAHETRVPRLLACVDALGLVLQEWVPGAAMPAYAAWGTGDAERMGQALAALHRVPLAAAPAADLADHERRTCHPGFAALAAAVPAAAATLVRVRTAIAAGRAEPVVAVTSHGDFGPRAVFAAAERTWLVDLDGVCRTDPAFDVATVRVGLEAHAGDAGRRLGRAFATAYAACGGAPLPALHVHEAFCDLRRAMIAWRKQPPGWQDDLRAALARAESRFH